MNKDHQCNLLKHHIRSFALSWLSNAQPYTPESYRLLQPFERRQRRQAVSARRSGTLPCVPVLVCESPWMRSVVFGKLVPFVHLSQGKNDLRRTFLFKDKCLQKTPWREKGSCAVLVLLYETICLPIFGINRFQKRNEKTPENF